MLLGAAIRALLVSSLSFSWQVEIQNDWLPPRPKEKWEEQQSRKVDIAVSMFVEWIILAFSIRDVFLRAASQTE